MKEVMVNTIHEEKNEKRQKNFKHLRSSSLSSLLSFSRQADPPILSSVSKKDEFLKLKAHPEALTTTKDDLLKEKQPKAEVKITLIEVKDLNIGDEDTTIHGIYCKFKLDTEEYKSKCASRPTNLEWNEKFKMILYDDCNLYVSLWDKGKESQALAKCTLDLSMLVKERTHKLWYSFHDTTGRLHLSIKICNFKESNFNEDMQEEITQWISNWGTIGELNVSVLEARGLPITDLNGKISAYCALQLDNQRVHTPKATAYNTLHWNNVKYTFNILDMTSTLNVKVYTKTLMNTFKDELLGKVSIPLLRINDKPRWYALKDKSQRNHAKGQCPRVLLDMSITWDAVKASMRLFRPKGSTQTKKPLKFDLSLLYRNLEFIRDTFYVLYEINEAIKAFLEWDDSLLCKWTLFAYLFVCFFFRLWMIPLLGVIPFIYECYTRFTRDIGDSKNYKITLEGNNNVKVEYTKPNNKLQNKSFTGKLENLQDMTITITNGIDYMASISDRLHNLSKFTMPFLPQLTIFMLICAAIGLYYIPLNYIFMALGIYKFSRKQLNPDRKPNNDVLDFISHMPDKGTLRDWNELDVPEYGLSELNNDSFSFTISLDDIQREISEKNERKNQVSKKLQETSQFKTSDKIVPKTVLNTKASTHPKSD